MQVNRPKHIPERSCAACGAKRHKAELVRIVRGPDGSVRVDLQGKKPGRGAYLCKTTDCWEMALKKGRLERVLKQRVSPEDLSCLAAFGASLSATGNETHV